MGSIKDKVAIVGMGCCKFGENWDQGADDMIIDAVYEAYEDAGVERKDIQAAWVGTAFSGVGGISVAGPLKLDRIRAIQRAHLTERDYEPDPPTLLYTCARQRAYPVVLRKGLFPMGRRHVLLAATEALALKIGKRTDADPVLLTVNTAMAQDSGCLFMRASERLFLCRFIPTGCFQGPALPKEKKTAGKEAASTPPKRSETPGSYFPDLSEVARPRHLTKKERRRDEVAWKSERRRKSREKG